jgi:hypothetical protein
MPHLVSDQAPLWWARDRVRRRALYNHTSAGDPLASAVPSGHTININTIRLDSYYSFLSVAVLHRHWEATNTWHE